MAGMSLLRPLLQRTFRAGCQLRAQNGVFCMPRIPANAVVTVRNMAEKRKMSRDDPVIEWSSFKDDAIFWFVVWLIPVGLVITYANFVVGQGELSDIPEGYEPNHWEYQKGPIQRWFARHVYRSYEEEYHRGYVAYIHDSENLKLKKLEKKVKSLMKKNQDHRSWYYYPSDLRSTVTARQEDDKFIQDTFTQPTSILKK